MDSERFTMKKKLTDLDFAGWGRFTEERCGFEVTRYQLPRAWNYQLSNGHILWDLHHNGLGRIQVDPPGGLFLTKMERYQVVPAWMVWLIPDGDPGRAFTNFYRPVMEPGADLREPQKFSCRFTPERGVITLEHDGWRVETLCETVPDRPAVRMRVAVENTRDAARSIAVMPALRPYATAANLAPWDVPELYHHTRYLGGERHAFLLRSMSPGGVPADRHNVVCLSDLDADQAIIDYTHFVGAGSWERPEALYRTPSLLREIRGRRAVFALRRETKLRPGEKLSLTMALGLLPHRADGERPDEAEVERWSAGVLQTHQTKIQNDATPLLPLSLPDPALARFASEYLAYQGRMVLHRGWPCSMLGTRDAAQDYTCVIATEPERVRAFLLELFQMERSDGWFVRQFSTLGRKGKHDERPYVDSGFFVWELLYQYLCQTGDRALLNEKVPYLDRDEPASLLDHARRLLDYFRAPENLGEHGLVKIREGDWNDAVNTAGLKGRGESVMVSCMAIIAWRQAARLLEGDYEASAAAMRFALRKHALNKNGFLNGVFNDDGRWIFSDRDPDGACRLSVPVNAFGVLADVFDSAETEPIFARIAATTTEHGIPLFWPPFGDRAIPHVGRLATGDLSAGLAENGAPYNHGSHGFLARAAAHAGLGDRLVDLLGWLFPYDQQKHPVTRTKTPPYAIANVWKTAPGWDGEGGDVFFTGGISAGLRAVYEGLLGIEPRPDGLLLHPCLPADWKEAGAFFRYRGCACQIRIRRGTGGVLLDGKPVNNPIPAEYFGRGACRLIEVALS